MATIEAPAGQSAKTIDFLLAPKKGDVLRVVALANSLDERERASINFVLESLANAKELPEGHYRAQLIGDMWHIKPRQQSYDPSRLFP